VGGVSPLTIQTIRAIDPLNSSSTVAREKTKHTSSLSPATIFFSFSLLNSCAIANDA
jgi:hypothetical protein